MKEILYIDHIADLGMQFRSDTLAGLFVLAAESMFAEIGDSDAINNTETVSIALREENISDLLVNWLRELLYLHHAKRYLFRSFQIKRIDGHSLEASALGETFHPGRHTIDTEIKAVTYHGGNISSEGGIWQCTIIFDV